MSHDSLALRRGISSHAGLNLTRKSVLRTDSDHIFNVAAPLRCGVIRVHRFVDAIIR